MKLGNNFILKPKSHFFFSTGQIEEVGWAGNLPAEHTVFADISVAQLSLTAVNCLPIWGVAWNKGEWQLERGECGF